MWRSLRARGRGVRERVLTYAEERAVGGLERRATGNGLRSA